MSTLLGKKKIATQELTLHKKETLRHERELKRQNNFFKRKRINPHTLYNTLVYIAPFFNHREEDWEEFLKLIIKENEYKRPNFFAVALWFHDTFKKSLNTSETKYLCRYVKLNSMADDHETKLRDSMDNIDLPPIKFDSWVNEMFSLEFEDVAGIIDISDRESPPRHFLFRIFDNITTSLASLGNRFLKKQVNVTPTKLSLSSKSSSRYRTAEHRSSDAVTVDTPKEEEECEDNEADDEDGDRIRKFSTSHTNLPTIDDVA